MDGADDGSREIGRSMRLASVPYGRRIVMQLLSTHGDAHYTGLAGLHVHVLVPISATHGMVARAPLTAANLAAQPADINVDGHTGDPRTVDKLVDGVEVTTDDMHMWLVAPPPEGTGVQLSVDLGAPAYIAGLRVYNYNKSVDDACRGVFHVALAVDGVPVLNPDAARATGYPAHNIVCLRRAPGHAWFDYGQSIPFRAVPAAGSSGRVRYEVVPPPWSTGTAAPIAALTHAAGVPVRVPQDVEVPHLPTGMSLQVVITATCGDAYYVGLDALALYDAAGRRIRVHPAAVHALPPGPGGSHADARVPANLACTGAPPPGGWPAGVEAECVQRCDDPALYACGARTLPPYPPHRSWLAAVLPADGDTGARPANILTITFDAPVSLSLVRLFNYSKTPLRGVGAVQLWLDGSLIFAGEVAPVGLAAAAAAAAGGGGVGAPHATGLRECKSIVFRPDATTAAEVAAGRVTFAAGHEQEVLCFNNGVLVPAASSRRAVERLAWQERTRRQQAAAAAGGVRPTTAVILDEHGTSAAARRLR